MKYLLDTQVFIWWAHESARLSSKVFELCNDLANELLLSMASVWEMQIKYQLGKLKLRLPLAELIQEQQQANQIGVLPITLAHILGLSNLPAHHKDPFDRLLVSQAGVEGLTLISSDSQISRYSVPVVW